MFQGLDFIRWRVVIGDELYGLDKGNVPATLNLCQIREYINVILLRGVFKGFCPMAFVIDVTNIKVR